MMSTHVLSVFLLYVIQISSIHFELVVIVTSSKGIAKRGSMEAIGGS